ncbi:hypothetical protein L484_004880 [Morus notabilis]|uniref:Uncharacterized protein n=1 Tax=Morus notabilis TaxID=981085 RepID=W9RS83_9ROSA|nr:hypothetical protein L484_004880 [Morus notabilis]
MNPLLCKGITDVIIGAGNLALGIFAWKLTKKSALRIEEGLAVVDESSNEFGIGDQRAPLLTHAATSDWGPAIGKSNEYFDNNEEDGEDDGSGFDSSSLSSILLQHYHRKI